jgi:hypothetical protein
MNVAETVTVLQLYQNNLNIHSTKNIIMMAPTIIIPKTYGINLFFSSSLFNIQQN